MSNTKGEKKVGIGNAKKFLAMGLSVEQASQGTGLFVEEEHIKPTTRMQESKKLRRRIPIKNFHRSMIDHVLDSTDIILGNQVKIGAFVQELSQNFVAIFDLSFLPGMLW